MINCKNCGTPVGSNQQFCPNCGMLVNDAINFTNDSSNVSQMKSVNVNEPTSIGFNRNVEEDLAQFGVNDPYLARNVNSYNNIENSVSTFNNEGMYAGDMVSSDNKKIPWFGIAIALVAVIIFGVFILPIVTGSNLKIYDGDRFVIQYNTNWKLDDKAEKMTLYYSDNNSRFLFNAFSTFSSLNASISDANSKKELYNQFYSAWSNIDGGKLTGGSDTFLDLSNGSVYAKVDYEMTNANSVGSFYVVINEKNDIVLSFMTYCTASNKEKIDKEVLSMMEGIVYKTESERSIYDKFDEGSAKEYFALGYMNYLVPDCWTLDENRTNKNQNKSNIFSFIDGVSILEVKGITPYNSNTGTVGISYDSLKKSIMNTYGAIKSEKQKSFKGKVWYIITTPDYDSGANSYHNQIYFTMSTTGKNLYYLEAYISNDTSEKKSKYIDKSIEYIIESASLLNVNE